MGGLAMRDDRPVAAGQDGGHVLAAPGQLVLGDGAVDAAVDAMKAGRCGALVDGRRAQSDLGEVGQREHQVLFGRQSGQLGV
jgi:hypothetical protein